jgi:hydrogenase nickel incorporation protein HypB
MSSPGSGKTRLIEALVPRLEGRCRIGAIEGDLATKRDAEHLRDLGVPAHQITTGSTCHLDAAMVHRALHTRPLEDLDLVFVENVGNLVCPGLYQLGCHLDGVLLSVAEGDDKVAKYPVIFREADFFCLTKCDLLAHVEFDPELPLREALRIRPGLKTFSLSAKTGEGVQAFLDHLLDFRQTMIRSERSHA